jgi:F0F1-type ATP synthase membrane subunit a
LRRSTAPLYQNQLLLSHLTKMKKTLIKLSVSAIFVFIFSLSANAQIKKVPAKALEITKDITYFVVGQSAKLTGEAVKAAAPVMLKTAEKTSIFMLRQTGNAAKNIMIKAVIPAGRQLIVKYLKYRLMP